MVTWWKEETLNQTFYSGMFQLKFLVELKESSRSCSFLRTVMLLFISGLLTSYNLIPCFQKCDFLLFLDNEQFSCFIF